MNVRTVPACVGACILLLLLATPAGAQQAEVPTWSVGDGWALGADDIDL